MENITYSEARKKVSLFSGRTYADAARRGAGRRLVTVGTQYSFADACTSLPPTKQPQAAPTFHVPEVELHQTPGTTQTTETPVSSDKPPLASEGPPEAMEVTPGSSVSKMLTGILPMPRSDLWNLAGGPERLHELVFFVRQNMVRRTAYVLPCLEKWIPGCGPRLLREGATRVFERMGDLSPERMLRLFQLFSALPEYTQSAFTAAVAREGS
ncbi:hypothetical protein HPB51_005585 [Rhipicephalus microplus]|uniref:Uncharacterized protein n=1 Tax=Rhipicephalus microplus TaxID=6941 RepID=A0A9J6E016_RHIMP|nr:hypothetical protein HPB51_005585 [Rhipicephalus microplus]